MLKITRARRQGRPRMTVGALSRQPTDLQVDRVGILFCDDDTSTSHQVENPTELVHKPKRGRPSKKDIAAREAVPAIVPIDMSVSASLLLNISSEPETVMQAEVQAKGSKKRVKESEQVRRASKRLKKSDL